MGEMARVVEVAGAAPLWTRGTTTQTEGSCTASVRVVVERAQVKKGRVVHQAVLLLSNKPIKRLFLQQRKQKRTAKPFTTETQPEHCLKLYAVKAT